MLIDFVQKKEFTEDKKNLFIVSNTFQLLNAIEAQSYFNTKNNVLVLLFFGTKKGNQKNIDKYIELFPYTQLITLQVLSISKLKETVELLNLISKFEYNKVFTGFFSHNYKRILCNLKYEKLYLVDDGIYTFTVHCEMYDPLYKAKRKKDSLIKRFYNIYRTLYLSLYNYSNNFNGIKLNFFTVYPLDTYRDEETVNHSYIKLKQMFAKKSNADCNIDENTVFFLGQPLSHISRAEYIHHLENINQFYKNKNLVLNYILHPAESEKFSQELQSRNIKIHVVDEPFELYFLKCKNIKNIASFFSSALFNIMVLDSKVNIDSFQLPAPIVDRPTVQDLYKFFDKHGIPVYQVEQIDK